MVDEKGLSYCLVAIICNCRYCDKCKVKKYRKESNLKWCTNVQFNLLLKYAQELFVRGDNHIIDSMKYYEGVGEAYNTAIRMIRSGGVQYD